MGSVGEYGRVEQRPTKRRHKAPEGDCAYCDRERNQGNEFHPSHDAAVTCESGARSHCSCDGCF